ncbi:MAG: MutS-related protein, partial [Longimicrobiales bacterium]
SGPAALWAGAGMGLALALFLSLVVWHRRVRARERRFRLLSGINRVALARLERDWISLPPTPLSGAAAAHPYALDLDVCGDASLFRLFTTVTVPPGQATLRDWLLAPAPSDEIRRRQEAVEELAPQVDLRQTLEATGRLLDSPDPESIETFLAWAEEEPWLPGHRALLLGARCLPLLTGVLAALQLWGPLRGPWWVFTLAASFGLASAHRGRIHALMEAASGGQERFGRYAALLTLLLDMEVRAPALLELQGKVRSSPVGASRELLRLGRRVAWADIRFSGMVHAPLQALLAWDLHLLALLEGWKRRSGPHVRGWLEALGRLEALLALAALRSDHPEWCFPTLLDEDEPGIRATGLGHPLLPPSTCVANDLEVGPPGTFLFVTGSNMSGKSTLLRAVGINSVLAQAGGPVCAERVEMTPLAVSTSMRTADSLAQGVSQYMAELKRIRQVVEEARKVRGVLYLLDEPLQGTNEAERRVAVQTILGHLLEAGAVGAVATHDLQLDGIPGLARAARAVHLEGKVEEGAGGPVLSFDYRLRPGRATSTNALALLRAVGLGEGSGPG